MIDRIAKILGAHNIASEDLIKKGLEKVNPKFKSFFSQASKYGYPVGAALGFLKSEFVNPPPVNESIRPDQAANREIARQAEFPERAIKTLGQIGAGAALGGGIGAATNALSGILPNQESQPSAATKGSLDGAANFIAKHPELGSYLDEQIKAGLSPEQAAKQAKKVKSLQPSIADVESNLGQDLVDVISYLFRGKGQTRPSETAQKSTSSPAMATFLDALKQFKSMAAGQGG